MAPLILSCFRGLQLFALFYCGESGFHEEWKAKEDKELTNIYVQASGEPFAVAQRETRERAREKLGGGFIGILYAASGENEFMQREVVPAVLYQQKLGVLDSQGRASARRSLAAGESSTDAALSSPASAINLRWALYTTQEFATPSAENALTPVLGFFDIVTVDEDVTKLLPEDELKLSQRTKFDWHVKSVKVRGYLTSPFDITIFLDFDSRPCRLHFAIPLLEFLGDADMALTNKHSQPGEKKGLNHFLEQHNSACVLMRTESPRVQLFARIYADAQMRSYPENRDQPSFMIALRAVSSPEANQVDYHGVVRPEVPPNSVLVQVAEFGKLHHQDFPVGMVCREKISDSVSCQDGCVVVHKPAKHDLRSKIFTIGFKKTGTASLLNVFEKFELQPVGLGEERVEATKALLGGDGGAKAVAVAEDFKAFAGAPWCAADPPLYKALAAAYPLSRFILTVRDSEAWWRSIRAALTCEPDAAVATYTRLLGAANFTEAAFRAAFEAHNAEAVRFFQDELKDPARLLVIDVTDPAAEHGAKGYSELCIFLETWGECPGSSLTHVNPSPYHLEVNGAGGSSKEACREESDESFLKSVKKREKDAKRGKWAAITDASVGLA